MTRPAPFTPTLSKVVLAGATVAGLSFLAPHQLVIAQETLPMSPAVMSQPATLTQPATISQPANTPTTSTTDAPAAPIDDLTLTAIPPRLGENGELKLKPGEKIQTSVRVRNTSNQTVKIESAIQDFVIDQDGSTPLAVDDSTSNRWSMAAWTTLTPTIQTLKPNQIGQVNIVIDVPADALPGGHYAMVIHRPNLTSATGTQFEISSVSGSGVNQQVGSLLYGMVEGLVNEDAFIRNLSFKNFSEFGPVPFSFTVENMSDVHVRPQVGVEIYNVFGKQVDTQTVDPKNVFPLMSRNFEGKWNRVWGIGPYTAKVTMSYGTQGKLAVAKTKFWLIPIKLVIVGMTLVLTLLALIIVIRRHLLHRQDDKQQRIDLLETRLKELENQPGPDRPLSDQK